MSDSFTKVSSKIYDPDWLKYAIPSEEETSNYLDAKNTFDGCSMYKPTSESCSLESFNQSDTIQCTDYIYDNTFFDETLSTKLNMVCENESYRSLLGTLLIIALLFGSLIGGRLGDKLGRKKTFFLGSALTVPVVIGMGYVQNYVSKYFFIYARNDSS